jgi:hypothetical protein
VADGSLSWDDIKVPGGIIDSSYIGAAAVTYAKLKTDDSPSTDEVLAYSGDGDLYWKADEGGSVADSSDVPNGSLSPHDLKIAGTQSAGKYLKATGDTGTMWDTPTATADTTSLVTHTEDSNIRLKGSVTFSGTVNLGTDQVGATEIDWGGVISGLRTRPFYFIDFISSGNSGTRTDPWVAGALASGTFSGGTGTANRPGVQKGLSSTSANSGIQIVTLNSTQFLIGGGELFETAFMLKRFNGVKFVCGFGDAWSGSSIPNQTDGVTMSVDSDSTIVGRTASNGTRKTTADGYTKAEGFALDAWYTARIVVNPDATLCTFYLLDATGSQVWSDTLQTASAIPTATGREFGSGVAVTHSGTTAYEILWLDYIAQGYNGRSLTR